MPATGSLTVGISLQDSATAPLGTYNGNPAINGSTAYTSANVTKVFQATPAATTSPVSYIVNNNSLSGEYVPTSPYTYTTVVGVVIQNTGANTLVIGGGTHPLFGSDVYTVQAGNTFAATNVPITVSSTVCEVTVTPSASTSWSIIIVGS